MYSADQCRKPSLEYQGQANRPGTSPKMASVLTNIARSFAGLASQYEILAAIADEERRRRCSKAASVGSLFHFDIPHWKPTSIHASGRVIAS